ncbi:hypothetical protein TNCV_3655191 [Trichonephila clavipes]|nr:hypothetical protein TNCV_3655191 [Trichonephila clavipes]
MTHVDDFYAIPEMWVYSVENITSEKFGIAQRCVVCRLSPAVLQNERNVSRLLQYQGKVKTASSLSRQLLCWHEHDSFAKTNRAIHIRSGLIKVQHIYACYMFSSHANTPAASFTGCGQPGEERYNVDIAKVDLCDV